MKCDGRDNTKKLWSFNSTVVSLKKCMSGYFFLYDTFIVGICNSNHSDNDDNESNKYNSYNNVNNSSSYTNNNFSLHQKTIIAIITVIIITIVMTFSIRRGYNVNNSSNNTNNSFSLHQKTIIAIITVIIITIVMIFSIRRGYISFAIFHFVKKMFFYSVFVGINALSGFQRIR